MKLRAAGCWLLAAGCRLAFGISLATNTLLVSLVFLPLRRARLTTLLPRQCAPPASTPQVGH